MNRFRCCCTGRLSLLGGVALALAGCSTSSMDMGNNPNLTPVAQLSSICNGVATTLDGRMFVTFPKPGGGQGASVAEVHADGHVTAYPNVDWNNWKIGDPAERKFVCANSLRIGPDRNLWVVDTGTPGSGTKVLSGGAKLVVIDPHTNAVVRTIPMNDALHPDSFLDDIRFNGPRAYLTDAGAPAILVLDLLTGHSRRVLENDASTTGHRPMRAQGRVLHKPDASLAILHADQLEVSPDGQTFYFQPACGPMSKIATRYLDDPSIAPADLSSHVQPFFDTPTTGGTCIDSGGNIYVDDADHSRVLKLTPAGVESIVIQDDRLVWGDALWIDDAGSLLIPAAQLNRSAIFNQEIDAVQWPVVVYKLPIGAKPVRN